MSRLARVAAAATVCLGVSVLAHGTAYAIGDKDIEGPSTGTPSGNASGSTLTAAATATGIKITRSGGGSGPAPRPLAPVDPQWEPPACWYEPVATPEQLKTAVDRLKGGGDLVPVTPTLSWGEQLMVDHYENGAASLRDGESHQNYNLGEDGTFWRGVINRSRESSPQSALCERTLFWQDAGTLPDDDRAPTPALLAAYAYDKIEVPRTEVELKPAARSTVNLPTWVWLDSARFTEVTVRAELAAAGVWAETTAKPVGLHLEPGTTDAMTYPSSGDCRIEDDGSIGRPYARGDADSTPPCGIRYLRATNGEPYPLKASVTWQITWEGSGGARGDLPDGTFETTHGVTVQEVQAVNR
ncbi:hypothetical protein ACFU5N_04220 [Streptomyces albidoflavus]